MIKEKKYEQYWNLKEFKELNLSHEFKNLVIKMLAFNPNDRPTIDEILQSPWLQEINNQNEALEQEVSNELHQRDIELQNQPPVNA